MGLGLLNDLGDRHAVHVPQGDALVEPVEAAAGQDLAVRIDHEAVDGIAFFELLHGLGVDRTASGLLPAADIGDERARSQVVHVLLHITLLKEGLEVIHQVFLSRGVFEVETHGRFIRCIVLLGNVRGMGPVEKFLMVLPGAHAQAVPGRSKAALSQRGDGLPGGLGGPSPESVGYDAHGAVADVIGQTDAPVQRGSEQENLAAAEPHAFQSALAALADDVEELLFRHDDFAVRQRGVIAESAADVALVADPKGQGLRGEDAIKRRVHGHCGDEFL